MSDEPDTTVTPEPEPIPEPEPQFVSKAEFMAGLTKLERTVQHIVDGSYSKIDKGLQAALGEVDRLAALAKAQGVDFPQAKVQELKTAAIQKALTEEPPPPQQIDPVSATAQLLVQQAGFTVTPDDPEYRLLDQKTQDPVAFLTSVKAALADKSQRINNPGTPLAGAPSAAGKGTPAPVQPTADSVTAELSQLLVHPKVETLPRIKELKDKLAKLTRGS